LPQPPPPSAATGVGKIDSAAAAAVVGLPSLSASGEIEEKRTRERVRGSGWWVDGREGGGKEKQRATLFVCRRSSISRTRRRRFSL